MMSGVGESQPHGLESSILPLSHCAHMYVNPVKAYVKQS